MKNSNEYKVDKGIPILRKTLDRTRFPFPEMEIGDSFLIPKDEQDPSKASLSIYTAVKSFNAHHGKAYKIATRQTPEGLRVWRVL